MGFVRSIGRRGARAFEILSQLVFRCGFVLPGGEVLVRYEHGSGVGQVFDAATKMEGWADLTLGGRLYGRYS